jgi:hypothetical protein
MALTTAFLSTCRTTIGSLAELSTFREALAAVGTGTRAERLAAWTAAYSPTATGQSLAYLLRAAIRNVINAAADGGQGPSTGSRRRRGVRDRQRNHAGRNDRQSAFAIVGPARRDCIFGGFR